MLVPLGTVLVTVVNVRSRDRDDPVERVKWAPRRRWSLPACESHVKAPDEDLALGQMPATSENVEIQNRGSGWPAGGELPARNCGRQQAFSVAEVSGGS